MTAVYISHSGDSLLLAGDELGIRETSAEAKVGSSLVLVVATMAGLDGT